MSSTYSPDLRIELIGAGEQAGTWNTTTNTNLGSIIEDAISGYVTVSVTTANQAFTALNGAVDQARNATVALTTTTVADFAVYAPPTSKQYLIYNTTAFTATIYNSTVIGNTTAAGLGVAVLAGKKMFVFTNGTNFRTVDVDALTTLLPVANGGTGASTAIVARDNLGLEIGVDIPGLTGTGATGTWGISVTGNAATATTAGSVTGTVAVANGGTGATTASGARTNLGLVIGTDVLAPNGSAAALTSFPTFNQNTTGTASNVTGTVAVANGGSGAVTLTGVLKGNGTSAFTAATAATDYVAPSAYTSSNGLTMATAKMLGRTTASTGAAEEITVGTGLLLSAGTLSSTASGGTVTSVDASGGTTGLTFSGGPVTASGTLTLAGTLDLDNGGTGATTASGARTALGLVIGTDVLAPTGSAASLTSFPTLNQNTSGTSANVTGTVVVANGGTGVATLTGLAKGNGTSAFTAAVAATDYVAPSVYASANGLTMATARVLGRTTASSGAAEEISIGSGLLLSAGTLSSTASGGTVTSVAVSGGTTGLTTSGGPITGSGTITIAGTLDLDNGGTGATTASGARTNLGLVIGTDVLAPSGSAAALTSFPTFNQNTTGTADNVTGTVAVANGGTGSTTASGARTNLGLVIGANVLAPNGSAASLTSFPTFNQNTTGTASNVTGTVAIANGGTGSTTASGARTGLGLAIGTDIPSVGGSGATGTWGISVSGNAGTASSAAAVSGTVGLANGGTGSTTAADARATLNVPTRTGGDASGTWSIAVTGNAGSATVLQTARTINATAFNGSSDITISAAAGTLTGGSLAAGVTSSSLTSVSANCSNGTYELGYRGLPSASVTTGAFVANDRGKCVFATGGVTVPNSTMSNGDVVVIQNTTSSAITITASVSTMRQTGTTNTGNRTLAVYGRCAILFETGTTAWISGDIT